MSFPRYPAYKDSGVEWLGEVPADWNVVPAKYGIASKSGGQTTKNTVAAEPGDGLFPAFSASGQDIWMEEFEFEGPALVLSAVGARCGKTFKADGRWGVVANTHCLFPRTDFNRDFLWYLTNREDWWERGGTAQPFVKVSETLARKWVFPSPCEQALIAQFLDHETAKIDALVAEQERLIELLKEKRQAVISHAVTKGLDPSVPMKDSGVEWIGEVPAHWEVKSLRYVLDAVGDVDHFMPASVDNGIPYLMTGDLKDFVSEVCLEDCKQVSRNDFLQLSKKIRTSKGDVVLARYATIGTSMYVDVDQDILVSYSCVTLKTIPSEMSGMYLFQYLRSDSFRQGIEHKINTNTQGNVGIKDLQELKVPVPQGDEQSSIITFLQHETSKVDRLKAEVISAIDLLQERRSALISAAVTGQIDVRQLA